MKITTSLMICTCINSLIYRKRNSTFGEISQNYDNSNKVKKGKKDGKIKTRKFFRNQIMNYSSHIQGKKEVPLDIEIQSILKKLKNDKIKSSMLKNHKKNINDKNAFSLYEITSTRSKSYRNQNQKKTSLDHNMQISKNSSLELPKKIISKSNYHSEIKNFSDVMLKRFDYQVQSRGLPFGGKRSLVYRKRKKKRMRKTENAKTKKIGFTPTKRTQETSPSDVVVNYKTRKKFKNVLPCKKSKIVRDGNKTRKNYKMDHVGKMKTKRHKSNNKIKKNYSSTKRDKSVNLTKNKFQKKKPFTNFVRRKLRNKKTENQEEDILVIRRRRMIKLNS
jgi:hypothetical protein